MRIRSHQRVGIGLAVGYEHHLRQILEVDLMYDSGVGRHYPEIVESRLAPAQKGVALLVALEFEFGVLAKGGGITEIIDLHRVVDHQFNPLHRIDFFRIAAQALHRGAHGSQVGYYRNTREVLQQDARGHKRDLTLGRTRRPARDRLDLVNRDVLAIFAPQDVLEHDADWVGQPCQAEAVALQGVQTRDVIGLSPKAEWCARTKTVVSHHLRPRDEIVCPRPEFRWNDRCYNSAVCPLNK